MQAFGLEKNADVFMTWYAPAVARGSGARSQLSMDDAALAQSGRGRYDRTASASERARQQRASLLHAVRAVRARDEELTVAKLLAQVGCGRNTFYEHFDDVGTALEAACEASASTLAWTFEAVLADETPRTPSAAMYAFAEAWEAWVEFEDGTHWRLLERTNASRIDDLLRGALVSLQGYLVRMGYTGGSLQTTRAYAIAGAMRAIASGVHAERATGVPSESSMRDASYDVLVRLLR